MDPYGLKQFGFAGHDDPAKWNKEWERVIKGYGSTNVLETFETKGITDAEADELLLNSSSRLRSLCDSQHRLTNRAACAFAEGDFESKWLRSNINVREKHLLEGIVRTCDIKVPFIEDERANCEEVTLPYLQKAKGRGFLTLLRHFMHEDTSSVPTTPIFLPSLRWDRMIGRNRKNLSHKLKIAQAYCDGNRNAFICFFLFNTLNSFLGHAPLRVIAAKAQSRNHISASFQHNMAKLVGKSTAKSLTKDLTATVKSAVLRCEKCGKTEFQLGKGDKFMWCKACKDALDRRVYYCSKECQTADWPRHKSICGKMQTLKDV